MNIKTDVNVTPESLDKGLSYNGLLRIALEGSQQQRDTLLDWGYSNLPAFVYENLCVAADQEFRVVD